MYIHTIRVGCWIFAVGSLDSLGRFKSNVLEGITSLVCFRICAGNLQDVMNLSMFERVGEECWSWVRVGYVPMMSDPKHP